jgi:Bacterial cell division membrane protein
MCSALSAVALFSIGQNMLDENYRQALVQIGASGLGLVVAIFLSLLDYHALAESWKIHAVAAWGLVLLTFIIGYAPPGTTNKAWIALPFAGLSLQPTELAKISFILSFAFHLSTVKDKVNEPKTLMQLIAHIGAPALLIVLQGDDGTMIIFVLIAATMLFAARLSVKYIVAAGGIAVVVAPLLWFFYLGNYQKGRILALFYPEDYPTIIWQQAQGKISIGAGQILGKGFFGVEHHTVPLAYNDFIFAYIAESIGFIGCIGLFALLLILALKTLNTASRSEDRLGYYICVGIFGMLIWQSVVNIGMCLSLLPVIGITLPFFSAGGTSVVTTYMAIGIVLSVYMHNKQKLFDE